MREMKGGQLGEKVGEKTGEEVKESLGEIHKLNLCLPLFLCPFVPEPEVIFFVPKG